MKLVAIVVVVFAASTVPASTCFLDIFGVCGGADRIAKTLDQLPERVREAAGEVLDHLFNDLLPPTVDKLTAAAQQLEDRSEKDYEQAVNDTRLAGTFGNPCQGMTVQECVTQAMKEVEQAREDLQKSKDDFDRSLAKESTELKIFTKECPDGWVEANATKGYVLVGRPEGGAAGTQLNRALGANESSRVAPHAHGVSDPGHTHGARVADVRQANTTTFHGYGIIPLVADFPMWDHGDGQHEIEDRDFAVANAAAKTSVAVESNDGEAYPLVYVLICQRSYPPVRAADWGGADQAQTLLV